MDELTFGQKQVGLLFNPSGDDKVAEVKQKFADIIDELVGICEDPEASDDAVTWASTAINHCITAQMWCVKSITAK